MGDPNGGNFEYTVEGLPVCLFAAEVPVTDIPRAVTFYVEALGMNYESGDARMAVVSGNGFKILLKKHLDAGVETNVFFGVDNPFDLHRRLVDEGVVFVKDPARGPLGLCTSFKDADGNILHAIEVQKNRGRTPDE